MASSWAGADIWKAPDKHYTHALERLSRRADPARVRHELVERGASEEQAADAVAEARATINTARRLAGLRAMLLGALLFLGGAAVTVFTVQRAEQQGGSYTVWWGAIGFGLVIFARGLGQFVRPAIRPELGSTPYRRRASPAKPPRAPGPSSGA